MANSIPSSDDRDLYLGLCRLCNHRKPISQFRRSDDGVWCCGQCAKSRDMDEESKDWEDSGYVTQPMRIMAKPKRWVPKDYQPPSRSSERRGKSIPHWMAKSSELVEQQARAKKREAVRNANKPDVMKARIPPRRR